LLAGALLLAGCRGIATQSEKAARRQAQTAAADYQPHGVKPVLPALTENSSLSNYLAYALLNQPKVETAYYDWQAAVERITQARSLPDPQFTFQMNIQNIVTSVMPGLMGVIPWPDKLRVGAQIASAEAESRQGAFRSAVLASAFDVKRAYYQLYFLVDKVRVDRETLQLLNDLETTARAQNQAGKVTLQDVLRAQIEQSSLKTEITNLEDSRSALVAQFKAALGLRGQEPTPPLPARFEPTALDLSGDQVLATALAHNTQLQAMAADVRAAEAAITLARRGQWPDFNLGLAADVKANPTSYSVPGTPGTVSLPIWRDKIAAEIAEAQANKNAAQARLTDAQISLAVEVAARSYFYRETTRNLALLDNELLPKARLSLELARAGYLAGQLDFFNLIDTERTLLRFELDKVEVATQREIVLAELSLIVQGMPSSVTALGAAGQTTTPGSGSARSATTRGSGGGM
jgi:outer membrane protein TolC